MENEIWKDVKGYEGFYMVSNMGNIKSSDRVIENKLIGRFVKKSTTIKLNMRGKYLKVSLCKNGAVKQLSVHRVVAEAFVLNVENKKCVNHINGIKTDNRAKNLEWVSYSENTTHSYANQLQISQKGSIHGLSKTNEIEVLKMREMYKKGNSITELSKMFGLAIPTIHGIVNNKSWIHVEG